MSFQKLVNVQEGTLHLNTQIPDTVHGGFWPHLVDIYEPSTTYRRAMVSLHGGGGTKQYQALISRILKATPAVAANVNWPIMKAFQVMFVFPQGQACLSSNVADPHNPSANNPYNPNGVDSTTSSMPNGVYTWSNGHHWSGANDAQFLLDLKTYLLNTFPALGAVHLHGHSDGGFMAWQMQKNYVETIQPGNIPYGYDSYLCSSATLPIALVNGVEQTSWNTYGNAGNTPLWVEFGRMDTVLGINGGIAGAGDHWTDPSYWSQQPDKISVANHDGSGYGMTGAGKFVPSLEHTVPGPIAYQRALNAWAVYYGITAETYNYGAATLSTTQRGDTMRTWSNYSGKITLRLIENVIHKYQDHQASLGHPLVIDMMKWIDTLH